MTLFKLAAFAVLALSFTSRADAATVNLSGTNYDLGTVVSGQNGEIRTTQKDVEGGTAYAYVSGVLAANTIVEFTYQGTASFEPGKVIGNSSYTDSILGYSITADSDGATSVNAETLPVIVLAYLSDPKTGIVAIKNLSSVAVDFFCYALQDKGNSFKGVYAVYGASPVPLPPAALLFISGLTALAGAAKKFRAKA